MRTVIGVISDTHGLMRGEALRALAGCGLILHAGDVGKPEVLDALGRIAPVHAVRGNVDRGGWAERLPRDAVVEVQGLRIYVLHDLAELDLDPAAAGFRAVVSGHSHRAVREMRGGVLYLNPGGAGPRRFRLPVTLARMIVEEGAVQAGIEALDVTQT
jgi:putative phosphoesterase